MPANGSQVEEDSLVLPWQHDVEAVAGVGSRGAEATPPLLGHRRLDRDFVPSATNIWLRQPHSGITVASATHGVFHANPRERLIGRVIGIHSRPSAHRRFAKGVGDSEWVGAGSQQRS